MRIASTIPTMKNGAHTTHDSSIKMKPVTDTIKTDMRENRVIKLPVFRTMFKPVARKPWKCDICKERVAEGQRYIHYIDRRVHKIIHYRFHDECFLCVTAYCKARKRSTFTPPTVRKWVKAEICSTCPTPCEKCRCKAIESACKLTMKR